MTSSKISLISYQLLTHTQRKYPAEHILYCLIRSKIEKESTSSEECSKHEACSSTLSFFIFLSSFHHTLTPNSVVGPTEGGGQINQVSS